MSYDQIQNDIFNQVRPPLLSPYFSAVWSYFGGPWRSVAGFSKPWGRDDDGDDYDNIDDNDDDEDDEEEEEKEEK